MNRLVQMLSTLQMQKPSHQPRCTRHTPRTSGAVVSVLRVCLLVLPIIATVILPAISHAALPNCWFTDASGNPQNAPALQTVTVNAVTITFPNSPAANAQIPNSQINPNQPVPTTLGGYTATIYINCSQNTGMGLTPLYGTYDPVNNAIDPPGSPGYAIQILRSGTPLPLYPTQTITAGGGTFSNTTSFKFYYTGMLPSSNANVPAGTVLGTWNIQSICLTKPQVTGGYNQSLSSCGTSASNYAFMEFISGGATLSANTCSVTSGNLAVVLPAILSSGLGAIGGTANKTPIPPITFNNCSRKLAVSFQISVPTSNISGAATQGVLISDGTASGVGFQILQPDGSTPVTFNSPTSANITTQKNITYSIQLFAQYYHISNPVSAGSVHATATYSLSYQ